MNSVYGINESIENIDAVREFNIRNEIKFKFNEVELEQINGIVKSFENKIGGRKLITYGAIKDPIGYTGYFYKEIINESLYSGKLPDSWKLSTIVPIEKIKIQ